MNIIDKLRETIAQDLIAHPKGGDVRTAITSETLRRTGASEISLLDGVWRWQIGHVPVEIRLAALRVARYRGEWDVSVEAQWRPALREAQRREAP